MRQVIGLNCIVCGADFPFGTSLARRYCSPTCQRNRALANNRNVVLAETITTIVGGHLLRVDEVAHGLGISPWTVREMIARGDIAAIRFGRSIRISVSEYDSIVSGKKKELSYQKKETLVDVPKDPFLIARHIGDTSIRAKVGAKGTTYRVIYRLPGDGRRQRSKSFKTRASAEEFQNYLGQQTVTVAVSI